MAKSVTVSELKTHCLRLVEEVATKHRDVVITKRGRRVAKLVPIDAEAPGEALAQLRGTLLQGDQLSDFETGAVWRALRK
jgi:prevent-host-death family protein